MATTYSLGMARARIGGIAGMCLSRERCGGRVANQAVQRTGAFHLFIRHRLIISPVQSPLLSPSRQLRHIAAGSGCEPQLDGWPYFFFLAVARSRRKSSASLTKRQSGMPNPIATE